MKRTILSLMFLFLFINASYPMINLQDSIYRDLCLFLASKHKVVENLLKKKNVDYKSLVSITDIFEEHVPSYWPDLSEEFGIYNFDYACISGHFSYILFKSGNSYKIYGVWDTSLIILDLLRYKEKHPELIDDALFLLYVKKLYDHLPEMTVVNIKKFGKTTYCSFSPIDK